MRATILELIESRGITRFRLGRLIGITDSSKMGWMYEILNGLRPVSYRALCRMLVGLNQARPLTESEADQIVRALLEAGDES